MQRLLLLGRKKRSRFRSCNAPRFSPPTFSRCFPAGFSDFSAAEQAVSSSGQPCGWDRILSCVGTDSIPVSGGQNLKEERPARAAGRSSRFVAQGLRSGTSPKKCRLFVFSVRNRKPSHARSGGWEGSYSRFLRSQLRRIGLGHPLGRDPLRTSMPATLTATNSGGHRPARCNLVCRLRRWRSVRCVWNTR